MVAAYSERRVLVEGWGYTTSWVNSPEIEAHAAYKPFWDQTLLEQNDVVFTAPTEENVERLRALGLRWLFVDKTMPYSDDLDDYATPRLETEWAWVLEL